MSTEHDPEYGPTPPGAQYEHTDIDPSIGYRFAVWLTVAMVLSVGIVYGTFWVFEGQRRARDEAARQFPLAAGVDKEAPSPRLQTQPFKDIYLLKQHASERLEQFGWVDKDGGIVHLPIDYAMELTLKQGLPVRAVAAEGVGRVAQDSSAGR
jgi:hypothetical protein